MAVQPGRERVVGQLGLVTHLGAADSEIAHQPLRIHHHFSHDGQALLVRTQRGQVGGEPLGQHGKHARCGIDRSSVDLRMQVDGRVFVHQRIDIGNGDQHAPAVFCFVADAQLVDVLRIIVVNRAPQQRAHVLDTGARLLRRTGNGRHFGQCVGRELRGQSMCLHGHHGKPHQIAAAGNGGGGCEGGSWVVGGITHAAIVKRPRLARAPPARGRGSSGGSGTHWSIAFVFPSPCKVICFGDSIENIKTIAACA